MALMHDNAILGKGRSILKKAQVIIGWAFLDYFGAKSATWIGNGVGIAESISANSNLFPWLAFFTPVSPELHQTHYQTHDRPPFAPAGFGGIYSLAKIFHNVNKIPRILTFVLYLPILDLQ